jgi:small subunit ribosomal protein S9
MAKVKAEKVIKKVEVKPQEEKIKEKTAEKTVTTKKETKLSYYFAVGRRKVAVARVKLHLGGDKSFTVNGRDVASYFPGEVAKMSYLEPLKATSNANRFTIEAKVTGSGPNGQLGAVIHAIGRALDKIDPEKYHALLRRRGFLTRDPRAKERRKVGTGGKARRQKQSPKR